MRTHVGCSVPQCLGAGRQVEAVHTSWWTQGRHRSSRLQERSQVLVLGCFMHVRPQLMVVRQQSLDEILGPLAHIRLGIESESIVLQQEMTVCNRLLVNTGVERSPPIQHFIENHTCAKSRIRTASWFEHAKTCSNCNENAPAAQTSTLLLMSGIPDGPGI